MKLLSGLICLAVAAGVVVNAIPAPQVDVTPIEELLVRDVGAGCDSGCLNDLRLCFAVGLRLSPLTRPEHGGS